MKKFFFILAAFIFASSPSLSGAQEKLSLTLTPPFVELALNPGEYFASSLKVVNTNPGPLTVYAVPMDFEAQGEEGQGKFTPAGPSDGSLANWIEVPAEGVTIRVDESGEVPFSIRVPENAPPGGHYAAILVGTKPYGANASGSVIKVSSYISSLVFVRVNGTATESGIIREFSSDRRTYGKEGANFTLRFENTGNVHLHPEGEIVVSNMWGNVVSKIPVNQETEFGNVLPKSARKFTFAWEGEGGIFSFGQYTAVVALTFGKSDRQNVSRTITFWVIPRVTVFGFAGLLALVMLANWAVRRHVRNMLRRSIEEGRPLQQATESVVDLRRTPKQKERN